MGDKANHLQNIIYITGSSVPNLMGMAGGGPGYGGYSPNMSDRYGQLGYMTDTMLKVII